MKTRLFVSLLLAVGLVLALMLAFTYAQGGDSAPSEATGSPVSDHDLNDPPAAGTKVLYMFTGVTDNLVNVATVVHCSNFGTMDSQIYVEFFDVNAGSDNVFTATTTIPENETRTFSTRPTALYIDHATANLGAEELNQGAGRVIVPISNTNFICTAQVIHSTAVPPEFGIKLTLYDAHGNIVGHSTPTIYLPIVLRNT